MKVKFLVTVRKQSYEIAYIEVDLDVDGVPYPYGKAEHMALELAPSYPTWEESDEPDYAAIEIVALGEDD